MSNFFKLSNLTGFENEKKTREYVTALDKDVKRLYDWINEGDIMALFKGLINDDESRIVRVDSSTNALENVDYEHHEVHGGSHYFLANGTGLAAAEEAVLQIDTPVSDKEPHMLFLFSAGLGAAFELYEGTDMSGTNYLTIPNSNRRSSNTSGCTASNATTGGSTTGTMIASFSVGSASASGRAGGSGRSSEELILNSGTSYLLVARSDVNANNVSTFATWYEHSPKD